MSITKSKINKISVKALPVSTPSDPAKIKGYDLFPNLYSNIFICSKKRSGKTCTIATILKNTADKHSNVIVFCSTFEKDDNWIAIKKYLESKKIPNEFYSCIHEEDALENIIEIMKNSEEKEEESDEEEKEPPLVIFEDDNIRVKKKKYKPKKLSPKYILIFDDVSTDLRHKNIAKLLKIHRHLKSKIILSSQWFNDLDPASRRQIDYFLIFNGINNEKLEQLYHNADLTISYEMFSQIYRDATKDKYNFMYIDVNSDNYRKNFNQKYIFEN
eukprot:Lithocolla_globosa_v1_NODE_1204_length_2791_cov_31.125457.p1 type:complete len:272 gc:universal NODE_1204_length_2791_cov_31.125457:1384-2199(+)